MPGRNEWETARQWGAKYGDLVYIKNLGTGYLFLNSYEDAIELFEKRGSVYSSRPQTTMLDLEGWSDWFTSVIPYGDNLRRARQYFNRIFQRSVTKNYYDVQTQSIHKLLYKLVQDPDHYRHHIRQAAAEAIIKIAYGYEILENDPAVDVIDTGIRSVSDALAFYLVNAVPVPTPSMLSKLTELYGRGDNETFIAQTVAVAFGAGGDTTVSALLTFLLAMVLFPDAMKKGHEELDRVIGKHALPSFEDRPRLPYIEAICKECLRWQAITPLAVPHLAEKDDIFKGYFIPAGTVLYGNVWAMLRDPKRYPDPDKFIPDRWLPAYGEEPPLEADKMAFGFGRRICPGRFFAENSIFIGVASILATFNIEKAVDEHGVPITPTEDYLSSIVRHPKPFKCKITPRSDASVLAVRQATKQL
ncbi:cytochrome P450 [Sanghuangporus baumii]|uniref:Cytochrome P450 n=1 Tax=Sanghuangporus baumii TaxID=108892 RepID=A0A9Q5N6J9_SANBA|nr:cytochrome P450 [Sanghuangporus baumii]